MSPGHPCLFSFLPPLITGLGRCSCSTAAIQLLPSCCCHIQRKHRRFLVSSYDPCSKKPGMIPRHPLVAQDFFASPVINYRERGVGKWFTAFSLPYYIVVIYLQQQNTRFGLIMDPGSEKPGIVPRRLPLPGLFLFFYPPDKKNV